MRVFENLIQTSIVLTKSFFTQLPGTVVINLKGLGIALLINGPPAQEWAAAIEYALKSLFKALIQDRYVDNPPPCVHGG